MGKTPKRFSWQNGPVSGTKLVVGMVAATVVLVLVMQGLGWLERIA
ncbi:MAG: hypothetical protein ABI939_08320 [Anaerolineaceae bacterium]